MTASTAQTLTPVIDNAEIQRRQAVRTNTLNDKGRIDDVLAQVCEQTDLDRDHPSVVRQVAALTNWTNELVRHYVDVSNPNRADWRQEWITLDEAAGLPTAGARWLIEDCVRANAINMVVGANKAGKSRLTLAIAESLVRGTLFLGEFPVPAVVPVALCFGDADGFDEHVRLAKEWRVARGLGAVGRLVLINPNPAGLDLLTKHGRRELIDWIRAQQPQPGVLVLDSIYNFAPALDDNDRAEVKLYMAGLMEICAEAQVAIIGIEHSPKEAASGSHSMIGSQVKGAATRSGLNVEVVGEPAVDTIGVRVTRWGNQGRGWQRQFAHEPAQFLWTPVEELRASHEQELCDRVIELLADASEAVKLTELLPRLGDLAPRNTGGLRTVLLSDGRFELTQGGQGNAWCVSVSGSRQPGF